MKRLLVAAVSVLVVFGLYANIELVDQGSSVNDLTVEHKGDTSHCGCGSFCKDLVDNDVADDLVVEFKTLSAVAATVPTITDIVIDPRTQFLTKITVQHNGKTTVYEAPRCDCKLSPKGSEAWNWRKTGTRHVPGIQVADVADLVDDADIFILSRGVDDVLKVQDSTVKYLESLGKVVYKELTHDAIALYAKLVGEGKRVAFLLHATC